MVGTPANHFGTQIPRTGNAYAGGFMFMINHNTPNHEAAYHIEYIEAQLTTPMIAGHKYYASFWVSLGDGVGNSYNGYIIDQLGAYFGSGYVDSPAMQSVLNFTPQVENPIGNWLSDTLGWMQISGTFTASGGENNIVIGSFASLSEQNALRRNPSNRDSTTYYYIDDVCVFDMTDATKTHDTTVCIPDFQIPLKGKAGFEHYAWNNGDTTLSIKVQQPGTYWVRSFSECGFVVDTFNIHQTLIPPFDLGKDQVVCDGSPVDIVAPLISGVSYLWQDSTTDNHYKVTHSGTYSVQLFKDGCSISDSIDIIIDDFRQDLGDDVSLLCNGTVQKVKLDAAVPSGAAVYWSTGEHTPSIIVTDSGRYWVRVQDSISLNGHSFFCSGDDTVNINIAKCNCSFNVPTAFSPNGDGTNDIFRPLIGYDCPVSDYHFSIYDRFGQCIYTSFDRTRGWDGTYQGQPMDIGTYFYEIKYTGGVYKNEYYKKGDVTLIR